MSNTDTDNTKDQEETTVEEAEVESTSTEEVEDSHLEETEETDPTPSKEGTYSKEEFDKAVKRRQRAIEDKRRIEKELRELKKATATKEQKLQMEAEEKAQEQAAKFKPALVKQHVAYEMAFLGLNKTQINQIVKFVEMENIDVDLEDNSVEGVEAEVARIREIFPDLFPDPEETPSAKAAKKPATKKRVPKVDGADKPAPPKPQTAMDKIRARVHKTK